ncbi:MAG: Hpt domain-containing protein [Oscillospiraceae bacterium]|nr:Hpt domain-containing protein [Oscillospiraceae bacterium]
MNMFKLSKAGINVNEGLKRFSGNAQLYERFLDKFPLDPNYAAMGESVKAKDARAAFAAAHALKGVAGNLSMTRLYTDLVPLVEVFRKGSLDTGGLWEPVSHDYEEIIQALQETE